MPVARLSDLEGILEVRTALLRGESAVTVGNSKAASHLRFSGTVVILDCGDCSVSLDPRLRKPPHWLARDSVLVYVVGIVLPQGVRMGESWSEAERSRARSHYCQLLDLLMLSGL